jgi:hypothetical protein
MHASIWPARAIRRNFAPGSGAPDPGAKPAARRKPIAVLNLAWNTLDFRDTPAQASAHKCRQRWRQGV